MKDEQNVAKGIIWSMIERLSVNGVSFIVQLFIARLLTPKDYGLIGMLTVFLAIAGTFVDSGFATALIQKKEADNKDFSTVFYTNIFIATFMYIVLFLLAPFISTFYNQPPLTNILRIVGLTVIINAISAINVTIINIRVDFKTLARVSLSASILSGIIGISMAYLGYGVWALVIQTVLSSLIKSILMFCYIKWVPSLCFSLNRLKTLFTFGVNILLSGLLYTIYNQLYSLIIGKRFSPVDLGYYSRADQLYAFPSSNLTSILKRVYFPVLCKLQDDRDRLVAEYRRNMKFACSIVFPMMMILFAIADPLVRIILSDKWIGCVWMLQILCFRGMLFPITNLNLDIINAIGESKIYLKIQTIVQLFAIIVTLILSTFADIKVLLLFQIIVVYFMFLINSYYVKKYFNFSISSAINDIKYPYILSITLGFIILKLIDIFYLPISQLFFGVILYLLTYTLIMYIFNIGSFRSYFTTLRRIFK